MKITDASRRLIEVYNKALQEQGGALEVGTSKANGEFRFALYEPLKAGQTRRKMVVSGPDIKSMFYQVGANYGINSYAVCNRAEELWANLFRGC